MKQHKYDIEDTEIRILGEDASTIRKRYIRISICCIVAIAIVTTIIILVSNHRRQTEVGIFEQSAAPALPHPMRTWLHSLDSVPETGVITKDTIVNDIPLRVYVPLNSTPRLEIGYHCVDDTINNFLFFQAADVRADNKKIVGAFVLRGKPLSWGLSKKGYCGIIGDEVTVGVADNSPLFEQATETGGYFFRQYPLVSNSVLVENELKSQSIRRGLCELEDRVVVVETLSRESLHDFSQALVDIGVANAIYLVGGTAIAWYHNMEGKSEALGEWQPRLYPNTSFIIWSR